jgi:hypothetical protein
MIIKNKKSAISLGNKIINNSGILDDIFESIKRLKRGFVNPEETKERAKIARFFSENGQAILSFLKLNRIKVKQEIIERLIELRNKAEAILRENPVLQTKAPIDVIKDSDMPVRYAINHLGKKELRKGFGLHKLPTTEQGISVCIAYMPPKHIQMYHNHTIAEHTLILDNAVAGIYKIKKRKIKLIAPSKSILHFSAFTVHTIYNKNNRVSRNITMKIPRGILDWKPFYLSEATRKGKGDVITKETKSFSNKNIELKEFRIKNNLYDYNIQLTYIKPNFAYQTLDKEDKYYFVVEGNLNIIESSVKKNAGKNDVIVIDKDTECKLTTRKGCLLYSIKKNI